MEQVLPEHLQGGACLEDSLISASRTVGKSPCYVCHSVCAVLLWQPWEINTQLNREFFFEGRAERYTSMIGTNSRVALEPMFIFWREPMNWRGRRVKAPYFSFGSPPTPSLPLHTGLLLCGLKDWGDGDLGKAFPPPDKRGKALRCQPPSRPQQLICSHQLGDTEGARSGISHFGAPFLCEASPSSSEAGDTRRGRGLPRAPCSRSGMSEPPAAASASLHPHHTYFWGVGVGFSSYFQRCLLPPLER